MFKLKTPQAALALTAAGAVPFLASAGAMIVWHGQSGLQQTAALWMMIYAAVILSFLGGVRWGAEMTRRDVPRFGELAVSTLGALVAWGLVLAFFNLGAQPVLFAAMALALGLHYVLDKVSFDLPLWYRRLRLWPTLAAVLSLAVGYILFR